MTILSRADPLVSAKASAAARKGFGACTVSSVLSQGDNASPLRGWTIHDSPPVFVPAVAECALPGSCLRRGLIFREEFIAACHALVADGDAIRPGDQMRDFFPVSAAEGTCVMRRRTAAKRSSRAVPPPFFLGHHWRSFLDRLRRDVRALHHTGRREAAEAAATVPGRISRSSPADPSPVRCPDGCRDLVSWGDTILARSS